LKFQRSREGSEGWKLRVEELMTLADPTAVSLGALAPAEMEA